MQSSSSSSMVWFPLKLKSPVELKLDVTLQSGQSFRWRQTNFDNQTVWVGPIGSTVFGLKEQKDDLYFTTFPPTESQTANEELLKKYFLLDLSFAQLKEEWSNADPNFRNLATTGRFDGLRLLQLDPVECLFCFICSQNNNIKRITKMVESLVTKYGKILQTVNGIPIYQFPTVQDIATNADEDTLRALGFGYRARYIVTAAKQIIEKDNGDPGSWLKSLPLKSREEVQKELVSLMGIGKKVADCISLFSMNKLDVIPVDTHVWQIAQTYMPSLRKKKLNDAVYAEIGDFFRKLFGPYTGWAHTLLFAGELSFFKESTPIKEEKLTETPPKAISARRKKNIKQEELKEEKDETPVKQIKRSRKNKS